jgi:hypothetical protein
METPILLDAVGVQLAPGQRVLYATAGIRASGRLTPGMVVRLRHLLQGGGRRSERIDIRRDDGRVVTISWARRIVVLRQESEADGWLRRQLASLGAR